ncbi:hypothetical protein Syun_012633 [Stephania yunnanensis]|uniref:AB hydrolase-1 domain-containing protein n=1 Tax=Stephania yunnanensis TaxID=152371 RepID=A0AAP0JZR8_9MAGN
MERPARASTSFGTERKAATHIVEDFGTTSAWRVTSAQRLAKSSILDTHTTKIGKTNGGPVVLLLHGFPELWYTWRHQIVALAAHGSEHIAFRPRNPSKKPTQSLRAAFGDDYYVIRFQEPGEMEAEFAHAGTANVLKKILTYLNSGPLMILKHERFATDTQIALPDWLTEADIKYYVSKYQHKGFTRCRPTGAQVKVPVKFIVGDLDLTYNSPGIKEFIHGGGLKKYVPLPEEVIVIQGAGFAGRWRDSHHGSREFVRWGSEDLRRPSVIVNEAVTAYLRRSPDRGLRRLVRDEEREKRAILGPTRSSGGDGKYYARGGRATKGSFSQRDWRGGHGSEQGRQHDATVQTPIHEFDDFGSKATPRKRLVKKSGDRERTPDFGIEDEKPTFMRDEFASEPPSSRKRMGSKEDGIRKKEKKLKGDKKFVKGGKMSSKGGSLSAIYPAAIAR